MRNETMNSIERVECAINLEKPDRVPSGQMSPLRPLPRSPMRRSGKSCTRVLMLNRMWNLNFLTSMADGTW